MAQLTFLVSFYNAEKYIASCIEDLKSQTNPDFLCILVDDGSTDKSFDVVTKKIAGDERFSVVKHETNKGVGAGRATGVQNTQTEFLTFIDADDKLEVDAVEKIINAIKTQQADLYIFDYFTKNEQNEVKRISGSAKTVGELFSTNDKRISLVWHKVFRTSLFEGVDFPFLRTVSFAEDLYICIRCFMQSRKTVIVPDAYYYYVYNSSSLVHSRTERSIYDNIAILQKLLSEKELDQFPEIESYIQNDSYHTFGQLIYPSKKNAFQWISPHFEEWRKINSNRTIFMPTTLHPFIRFYIKLITEHHDRLARCIWQLLKIRKLI